MDEPFIDTRTGIGYDGHTFPGASFPVISSLRGRLTGSVGISALMTSGVYSVFLQTGNLRRKELR